MDKDQVIQFQSQDSDHSRSVSGDNNSAQETNGRLLSIKFKIPRTEIAEEEEEENSSPLLVNSSVRVCPECGKTFNSGKALGGHRRSHVQAKLKAQKVKKAEEGSGGDANDAGDSMKVSKSCTCYLCHRTFPSVKSLFGHMKSHPERDWRGIQPPQGGKHSALDTVLDNQIDCSVTVRPVVNLRESIKGWAAKAKRGRGSLVAGASFTYLEGEKAEEEEEREMEESMREDVNDLLLLAEECSKDFEGGTKKQEVEFSPDDYGYGFDNSSDYGRNFSTGTLKIKEKMPTGVNNSSEIVRDRMDRGKGKALLVPGFDSEDSMSTSYDSGETEQPMEEYEDNNEVESTRKMNKKRKLADLEKVGEIPSLAQDRSPTRHICSICNKSFPSHQALGGHKASHNKPKKIHTTAEDEKQVSEESAGGSRMAAVSGEHKCNICNEIFPTGMALGGHKRRHWTGPVEAPSSSSQGTSSPTEVTQMAGRVCGFDLNEPAPEEDDDVQDIQPVSVVPGEASAASVMLQN